MPGKVAGAPMRLRRKEERSPASELSTRGIFDVEESVSKTKLVGFVKVQPSQLFQKSKKTNMVAKQASSSCQFTRQMIT